MNPMKSFALWSALLLLWGIPDALAQENQHSFPTSNFNLQDLSAFQKTGDNWTIIGGLTTDINQKNVFKTFAGKGVLVNQPTEKHRSNIVTTQEFSDLDLEFEFMMAKGANSGVYLQGRYEIQLLDSWGKKHPSYGDCGGVYERWDEGQPNGQKGYEGHAPRINVCRAPGLWQTMKIAFQAPRFDSQGKKIANARILEIKLNDVIIHEDVELTGPTRGPAFAEEAPLGPLLIQGDHGAVAFRKIRYRDFSGKAPKVKDISYLFSRGVYDYPPDFTTATIAEEGKTPGISWEAAKTKNEFGLQFTGTLPIEKAGEYLLNFTTNGNGEVYINGERIFDNRWWSRSKLVTLPAGDLPIVVSYAKREGWLQPRLGLFISGANFRRTPLHLPSSFLLSNPVDPILVEAKQEPKLLRCFIDYPSKAAKDKVRIVHALSIGHPDGIHCSYDLDRGMPLQIWKGGFLDATPMWNSRGDGSAAPLGSVILLPNRPSWQHKAHKDLAKIPEKQYRYKGYDLDEEGMPTFRYQWYDLAIKDRIIVEEEGKMFTRILTFDGKSNDQQFFQLAYGENIVEIEKGLYQINNQQYYLRVSPDLKPVISSEPDHQALNVSLPASGRIQYSLIW